MEFRLFGEVTAISDAGDLGLGSGRPAALLSLLLLQPGRVIPVQRIVDDLWGEEAPSGAVHAVRVYVSRLRAALATTDAVIVTRAGGYFADVLRSDVDLLCFEDLASEAAAGRTDALDVAERALALWTADPLADFTYDDFAVQERRRLAELRLDVIEVWASAALDAGKSLGVTSALLPLVDEHPYRERLWAHLATALYREDRQTEAVRTIERARSALKDLGLELGIPLAELESAILGHDAELTLPPSVEHNLPAPIDSFVGRAEEVAEIEKILHDSRLVTLTGPGGCGKTRLAVETARHLLTRFDDRVWLVDLASVTSAETVPAAAADAVGVGSGGRKGPTEKLAAKLSDEPALLVLDNCEHVIEAAALLAEDLLRRCSELRIIATSREPLRIAGETVFIVPSLSVPEQQTPVNELGTSDAVILFSDRASSAAPDFALTPDTGRHVVKIVRMLDGIPLAIELAAVRVRTLPVDEMSRRFDDVLGTLGVGKRTSLPRHRTLEAALDWSTQLLNETELAFFRRLGVFRSSFGLRAAAAVAGDGNDETTEALLADLVEKSMLLGVVDDASRYRLLEPIRQYSMQQLDKAGDLDEVERRRDAFYSALASEAEAGERRFEDPSWRDRIRMERPNMVASVDSLTKKGNVEAAAHMTAAIADYWVGFGLYDAGKLMIDRMLATSIPINHRTRSRLLRTGTWLAVHHGDSAKAESFAEAAMTLADRGGTQLDKATIFNALGSLHGERGDLRKARDWISKALEITTSVNPTEAVSPMINLASLRAWAGDPSAAEELSDRAAQLNREVSPTRQIDHFSALIKGVCARMRGDLDAAAHLLEMAISGLADRGPEFHLAYSQVELAHVAYEQGHLRRTALLCELLARSDIGETPLFARIKARLLLARLAATQGSPHKARIELLAALTEAEETTTVGGIAEAADIGGHLSLGTHQTAPAAQLLMSSSLLRRDLDLARDAWEKVHYEKALTKANPSKSDLQATSDPGEIAYLIRQIARPSVST